MLRSSRVTIKPTASVVLAAKPTAILSPGAVATWGGTSGAMDAESRRGSCASRQLTTAGAVVGGAVAALAGPARRRRRLFAAVGDKNTSAAITPTSASVANTPTAAESAVLVRRQSERHRHASRIQERWRWGGRERSQRRLDRRGGGALRKGGSLRSTDSSGAISMTGSSGGTGREAARRAGAAGRSEQRERHASRWGEQGNGSVLSGGLQAGAEPKRGGRRERWQRLAVAAASGLRPARSFPGCASRRATLGPLDAAW